VILLESIDFMRKALPGHKRKKKNLIFFLLTLNYTGKKTSEHIETKKKLSHKEKRRKEKNSL
jgi:hypothetical protein